MVRPYLVREGNEGLKPKSNRTRIETTKCGKPREKVIKRSKTKIQQNPKVIPIKVNTKIKNILFVLHRNAFYLSFTERGGYPAKGGG